MAQMLNTSQIPKLGIGILHPLTRNKFFIQFDAHEFTEDGRNFITQQTVKFVHNAVKKTIQVSIEQPVGLAADFIELISDLAQQTCSIKILVMNHGAQDELQPIASYRSCQCIDHKFELDYSQSDAATHEMVFTYDPILLFRV